MKTNEERIAPCEAEAMNKNAIELNEQETAQVAGGISDVFFDRRLKFDRIMTDYHVDRDVQDALRPLFKQAFESGDETKLRAAMISYYEQKRIEAKVITSVLCLIY